jgi:nitrogen fixation NifU-like protein
VNDLGDLYQEVILDHNRAPRNFRALAPPCRHAEGFNPVCGDRITVYLDLQEDVVRDVAFQGSGCAISKASASLMTESVRGRTRAEAQGLFEKFHGLVTGRGGADGLGKLVVFGGVSEFPIRVKCATLAWHTLRAAMENRQDTVSTE